MSDRKRLTNFATIVAALSMPVLVLWLVHHGSSLPVAIIVSVLAIAFWRGMVDHVLKRILEPQNLFEENDSDVLAADALRRRRIYFWGRKFRLLTILASITTAVWLVRGGTWVGNARWLEHSLVGVASNKSLLMQAIILPFFFLANFAIFMGPLMLMGISQIRGFEPGDADWGVRLEDVRGQKEAKEEIRKVVTLWSSGDKFAKLGGKRERGMLFLGPPGVGKTMLAKAIATSFNSPIVTIPGSGFAQAQPLDAKVLTPTGWKLMGAMRIGDDVINPEGGTSKVVGVFPQGERDIYRVTFSDGSSTRCDIDHRWRVRGRNNDSSPWRTKHLSEIQGRLSRLSRQARPYIPLVENVEFPSHDLPVDPYLLGVLLGNGCFVMNGLVVVLPDAELVERVRELLPGDVELRGVLNKELHYRISSKDRMSNSVIDALRDLGLAGHKSDTKFVPDEYKFAPTDVRLAVLQGLLDTDGSASMRGETIFATTSPQLAADVQELTRSLGGTASIRSIPAGTYAHPDGSDRPSLPSYFMTITLSPSISPFLLTRKAERRKRQWEPCRRIVSIEKVDQGEVQCIKVDHPNESYVTDDYIVTLNTFIGLDAILVRFLARKARKLAGKWGGSCICFIDEIDAVGMRRAGVGSQIKAQMPGGMMGGMGSQGLQSLLVVMDSIDSPPFMKRLLTNRVNMWLDAIYVIPQRVGRVPLRLPRAKPSTNQIFWVGATNVPLQALDPALTRAGRMGRHVYFRTPTKKDRLDIFDLYIGRLSHDVALDEPEAREELARITAGYSPAEIEQACNLALTYATNNGRDQFTRADILEAMVVLEAGTALGWGYEDPKEEFSTAVHEAGHAVCAHLYLKDTESTRLTIQRRGDTGGHHQTVQTVERSFKDRVELFADLIWGLGAYAAEIVFFGNSTQGVGGDLGMTSYSAGLMVGRWGMAPLPLEGPDLPAVRRKLEAIGKGLLAAANPGDIQLSKEKYRDEAIIMGHAYLVAYNTIRVNEPAVRKIAEELVQKKEIYGNDLIGLLDSCELKKPKIDWSADESWPTS